MTEKIQKYQIIKFDSFDFLITSILKKISTHRQTDRPTDRPTDILPYRRDLPSLKKPYISHLKSNFNGVKSKDDRPSANYPTSTY